VPFPVKPFPEHRQAGRKINDKGKTKGKGKVKSKVKGSGQECLLHTGNVKSSGRGCPLHVTLLLWKTSQIIGGMTWTLVEGWGILEVLGEHFVGSGCVAVEAARDRRSV